MKSRLQSVLAGLVLPTLLLWPAADLATAGSKTTSKSITVGNLTDTASLTNPTTTNAVVIQLALLDELLAGAQHDYQGHRAAAMSGIVQTCRIIQPNAPIAYPLPKTPPLPNLTQAQSDSILSQVRAQLVALQPLVKGNKAAAASLASSISQINIALKIK